MVFSSLLFMFRFLPVVLLLYFIIPKRWRNLFLFLASLVFYAWGEPVYVLIMLFSTILDYNHGRLVEKHLELGDKKKAKFYVASSMVINLLVLGFFKYTDFIIGSLNGLLGTQIPLLNLALPIGISFYTFQTMSYTVDVYRGQAKAQKDIIAFGAYVALFPQLVAGPIVQYKTIAEQLTGRRENVDQFSFGIRRFVLGLGKKVLLANNIGYLWDIISAMDAGEMSVLMAWIGAISYTFQIYFDFSGYSDMAIGLGNMFGFQFLENFNYPYISKSVTEFWRRWHISLGSWFREYVYIPLGGNRCGAAKQVRNLAITWCLTGIWHGAAWNFLLWGVYYGFWIIIEKLFLLKWMEEWNIFFKRFYTLFIVVVGWVIFAFDNMGKGLSYLRVMFCMEGNGLVDDNALYYLIMYGLTFIILIVASTELPKKLVNHLFALLAEWEAVKWVLEILCLFAITLASVAYLVNSSYNPFLYFRF